MYLRSFIKVIIPLLISSLNGFTQGNFIRLYGNEELKFDSISMVQKKYEKPYFKVDGGKTYRVENVEAFQNYDGYFIKNNLTVSKRDFAHRISRGKIDIYKYDLIQHYVQEGQSNTRYYYAYKKYDGPLKQMIYENLMKDLEDNPLSLKKLNKIRAAKRVAPLYYILGGVTIVTAGILFNTTYSDFSTPLFISGVALISIPWVLNLKRDQRMNDAINIYNDY